MDRYVLRYRGPSAPADEVEAIRRKVNVVDSSGKMMLVEADPEQAEQMQSDFPEWLVAKEAIYRIPERRHQIRKPV